jgi:hypothetical protein
MEKDVSACPMVTLTKENTSLVKNTGRGVYKWHDGRVYDGMYRQGKINGRVCSYLVLSLFFQENKIKQHVKGLFGSEIRAITGWSCAF